MSWRAMVSHGNAMTCHEGLWEGHGVPCRFIGMPGMPRQCPRNAMEVHANAMVGRNGMP